MEGHEEIERLIHEYQNSRDYVLSSIIQQLESTETGKAAIKKNPNRRIYAVAKPTHEEYLERLEALLKLTDGREAELLRLNLFTFLSVTKFLGMLDSCILLHYSRASIRGEAALDLHNRLWGIVPVDAPIAG